MRFSDWRARFLLPSLVAATLLAMVFAWRIIEHRGAVETDTNSIAISSIATSQAGGTVEISGVVTFVAERVGLFYVQDNSGALAIALPAGALPPVAGDKVVVRGRRSNDRPVQPGSRDIGLRDISIVKRGHSTLPHPETVQLDDIFLASNTYQNRFIETTGVVRAAVRDGSMMRIEIGGREPIAAYIVEAGSLDAASLVDGRVSFSRGVVLSK